MTEKDCQRPSTTIWIPGFRAASYVMPHRAVSARFLLTLDGTTRRDSYETVFIDGMTVPYHAVEASRLDQAGTTYETRFWFAVAVLIKG